MLATVGVCPIPIGKVSYRVGGVATSITTVVVAERTDLLEGPVPGKSCGRTED